MYFYEDSAKYRIKRINIIAILFNTVKKLKYKHTLKIINKKI